MFSFGHIITGIMIGVVSGGLVYAFLTALSLPDVWFSYSTGECVKVLNYEPSHNFSCENLPFRFYHVWVE